MRLTDASVAMLVFWTLLRWERRFLLIGLEDMGVDMWGLTREVDALLEEENARGVPGERERVARMGSRSSSEAALDRYLQALLDRADLEALGLRHNYLGTEHLLLAIIAGADHRLSSVLLRYDITHANVKNTVLELLRQAPAVENDAETVGVPEGPRGARWDSEAVGVPRRFGVAVLMLLVTMYAVLFSVMTLMDAHPIVFIVIAVLFTGTGLGQMLLFEGKYPRAASVWVGACLLPLEILVLLLGMAFFPFAHSVQREVVLWLVFLLLISIPLGAGLGYLSGGLTAGAFLLIERYKKYREDRSGA
jgi:hypothetical protein